MNAIDQSGILAIATRLQRLSDRLRKDGKEIYLAHGVEFDPKWFPVIYTLHLRPVLSVVEIAAEIGYAHPSTITLLKELEAKKLIRSHKDKTDTRKRMIRLTDKGTRLVEKIQPCRCAGGDMDPVSRVQQFRCEAFRQEQFAHTHRVEPDPAGREITRGRGFQTQSPARWQAPAQGSRRRPGKAHEYEIGGVGWMHHGGRVDE